MIEFISLAWKAITLITGLLLVHQVAGARLKQLWQFVSEIAFACALVLTYFVMRGTMLGQEERAVANSRGIIRIERHLGIFQEGSLQDQIIGHDLLVRFANWVYVWWHWPLIVIVLVWLCLNHPHDYVTYRNAFVISGVIGLVIFAVFPAAPPRFMAEFGFQDTVDRSRPIFLDILLPPDLMNRYAAMPSLHAGWNLLIGIALFRHSKRQAVRAFGILMPILMLWSIVVTGNHFILDGLIGNIIAGIGLLVALLLARRSAGPLLDEEFVARRL